MMQYLYIAQEVDIAEYDCARSVVAKGKQTKKDVSLCKTIL